MKPLVARLRSLSATEMARSTMLCERVHRINTRESFANHTFAILKNAVECKHFCFLHFKTDPLELVKAQCETIPPEIFEAFETKIDQHPLLQLLIQSPKSQIRTLQTAMPKAEFRKTELYNELLVPLGIKDQLILNLRHKRDLFIISYEREKTFSKGEQTLMQLIQPHVQLAWENWHAMRKLEQRVRILEEKTALSQTETKAADAIRQSMSRLTPRQRDIGELVAQGLENRAIAKTLHIAPKTVGKHLENIFQTLEIHHRAALAAQWRQAEPLKLKI